jgi:DNA-directed RNA polymerase subunit L/DNA-directed RNA polymerase alpha subunit
MEPQIAAISEENQIYKFTLYGVNVSIANALRRTILMDIPIVVFRTESHENNDCTIHTNTGRLHNEILKQRLSCIPVHIAIDELEKLPGKYVLEVHQKNDSDAVQFVTTEHFNIRSKNDEQDYLPREEVQKIFPPFQAEYYIDFARLRPRISDTIPGEELKLTSEFSISSAKENSMFNSVSKCAYGYTPDLERVNKLWSDVESGLQKDSVSKEDIDLKKKNFYLLDAQRVYLENSFDFVVKTVGVYDNAVIVKKAAEILVTKFRLFSESIDSKMVNILMSETSMDYCYDIYLDNEDYTMGKVLEYILYNKFYENDKLLSFCGFRKYHPHDSHSIIRVAFNETADKTMVQQILKVATEDAKKLFEKIYDIV